MSGFLHRSTAHFYPWKAVRCNDNKLIWRRYATPISNESETNWWQYCFGRRLRPDLSLRVSGIQWPYQEGVWVGTFNGKRHIFEDGTFRLIFFWGRHFISRFDFCSPHSYRQTKADSSPPNIVHTISTFPLPEWKKTLWQQPLHIHSYVWSHEV